METRLDSELERLNNSLFIMGGCVEGAIGEAIEALMTKDAFHCKRVFDLEERINKAHIEVDDICWKMLARSTPVASGLRAVLAAIKINTDLERMGDLAVNIAYNSETYIKGKEIISITTDVQTMTQEVRKMVKMALDALVVGNTDLARQVLKLDDVIDQMKDQLVQKLIGEIKKDTTISEEAVTLILIAKNLERIGDHATNIAEDVIFITSGKDVRHQSEKKGSSNGAE